jgi:hypothetical protein
MRRVERSVVPLAPGQAGMRGQCAPHRWHSPRRPSTLPLKGPITVTLGRLSCELGYITDDPVAPQVAGAGDAVRIQQVYNRRRQHVFFIRCNFGAERGNQIVQAGMDSYRLLGLSRCTWQSPYHSLHDVFFHVT